MEIDLVRQSLALPIKELHDVGDARRQIMHAGKRLNFDETANGRIGIVVTELAGNLVKHAGGGTLIIRALPSDELPGLEIMSIDDGPGMDVTRCMEDGYSTAGSPGTGLGAIQRLAAELDIYSLAQMGTVMVVRLWPQTQPVKGAYDIGAICLPVAGETLCGDGWTVQEIENGLDILVVDGLGHGAVAAQAADKALDMFKQKTSLEPGSMMEVLHGALRPTRGAAALTVKIDYNQRSLVCAGVGNIAGAVLVGNRPRGMVSFNGIVGHQIHKIKEFTYECSPYDAVIFHSDGLTTHWKLEDFPGLAVRSSSLIAGVLYKNFKRGKDDATVVVVRRH